MNATTLDEATDPEYAFDYVDISSVTPEDGIARRDRVTFGTAPSRARRRVVRGDTIISTVRTYLRAVAFIEEPNDLVVSTGFCVLTPRAGVDHRYLYRAVQSKPFVDEVVARSAGVSYPAISPTALGHVRICLPDAKTQRAIVDFLDRETEKIDALVAKKQRLIELLQEKRTALISHAVTKGLDPHAPMKESGIEWLSELPVSWQGLSLKRCVTTPITDGPHETPEFADDGMPFLSADAVQGGVLDFSRKRGYISRDLHEQYCQKCRPRRGDILMCKSGATTGKLALVQTDVEFSVWSPLALIRPDERVVRTEFLAIALESEYVQDQIRRTWSEGTQPNISMASLGRLCIAVPPVEVQDRIVEMTGNHTAASAPVMARIGDCLGKLREYRSALITAAVTGQIDVRAFHRKAS